MHPRSKWFVSGYVRAVLYFSVNSTFLFPKLLMELRCTDYRISCLHIGAMLHTAALECMLELCAALPDQLSSLLKNDISFVKVRHHYALPYKYFNDG